jgi:hypothetical protein
MFAPAQLLRNWREQRPSIRVTFTRVSPGRLGEYTAPDGPVSNLISSPYYVFVLGLRSKLYTAYIYVMKTVRNLLKEFLYELRTIYSTVTIAIIVFRGVYYFTACSGMVLRNSDVFFLPTSLSSL